MESVYQYGAIVYTKTDPSQKMIVRRVDEQTYYCRMLSDLGQDEIGYPLDELEADKRGNAYD